MSALSKSWHQSRYKRSKNLILFAKLTKAILNYSDKILSAKKITLTLIILFFMSISNAQPLQTVSNVDLNKYSGKWYEIASFPQRFQKGCKCTTAEYTLNQKGFITVENRCRKGSVEGKESYIKGKAFVEKGSNNAKLKVQFFWPFKGKYWIIELANDYSYSVVSHPNKKYLWILSRSPKMNPLLYLEIISRLKSVGLQTERLILTQQI